MSKGMLVRVNKNGKMGKITLMRRGRITVWLYNEQRFYSTYADQLTVVEGI